MFFGLGVVYFDDDRFLLVTDENLLMIWVGLCFRFRPASLLGFCWVSYSTRFVFMLPSVSW